MQSMPRFIGFLSGSKCRFYTHFDRFVEQFHRFVTHNFSNTLNEQENLPAEVFMGFV